MCDRRVVRALLLAAVLLHFSYPAGAADKYWQATSGDWSTSGNRLGGEPTSNDNAYISNGGTTSVTLSGEVCSSLSLGGTGSGTVQMTSGTLSTVSLYIGNNGTGVLQHSGGTNYLQIVLGLGWNAGDNGTYNLSSGFLRPKPGGAGDMDVGYKGTGTFVQSGGTNGADGGDNLYLGYYSKSKGSYQLGGTGQLLTMSQYIGNYGTGQFVQLAGTNTIGNASYVYSNSPCLYLGYNVGGSGTYTLSGGQLLCITAVPIGSLNMLGIQVRERSRASAVLIPLATHIFMLHITPPASASTL